jgi:hypothetical protein
MFLVIFHGIHNAERRKNYCWAGEVVELQLRRFYILLNGYRASNVKLTSTEGAPRRSGCYIGHENVDAVRVRTMTSLIRCMLCPGIWYL